MHLHEGEREDLFSAHYSFFDHFEPTICAIITALPSEFGVGVNTAARIFSLCILASPVPERLVREQHTEIIQLMPNVGRICAGLTQRTPTARLRHQLIFTSTCKMLGFFSWGGFTVSGSVSNSIFFIPISGTELFNIFTVESFCHIQMGCISAWV